MFCFYTSRLSRDLFETLNLRVTSFETAVKNFCRHRSSFGELAQLWPNYVPMWPLVTESGVKITYFHSFSNCFALKINNALQRFLYIVQYIDVSLMRWRHAVTSRNLTNKTFFSQLQSKMRTLHLDFYRQTNTVSVIVK